jgi:hypothetical protein
VRGHRDIPFAQFEITEIKVTHDKRDWKKDVREYLAKHRSYHSLTPEKANGKRMLVLSPDCVS